MEQHLHHDLDLIADYAEGLLADSDEARRLVDACADCRGEYDLQRAVKGMLGGLPPTRLTDLERSRLHAVIDRVPAGNVVTLTDRRRVQWWMRVASVAAAAFVLVGLGTVFIGMMGSGSQSAATSTIGDSLEAGSAAESFETTTAAAATLQGEEFASDQAYRLLAGGDADSVRAEINSMLEGTSVEYAEAAPRDQVCLEELADREVLDVAQSRLDGRPIVIVIVATDDGKEAIVYDEATCLLVEIPPE